MQTSYPFSAPSTSSALTAKISSSLSSKDRAIFISTALLSAELRPWSFLLPSLAPLAISSIFWPLTRTAGIRGGEMLVSSSCPWSWPCLFPRNRVPALRPWWWEKRYIVEYYFSFLCKGNAHDPDGWRTSNTNDFTGHNVINNISISSCCYDDSLNPAPYCGNGSIHFSTHTTSSLETLLAHLIENIEQCRQYTGERRYQLLLVIRRRDRFLTILR